MPIHVTKDQTVDAFAVIADINDFARTVAAAEKGSSKGEDIADFTRDALKHVVQTIEAIGGEVAALMGDGVLGIVPEGAAIRTMCNDIAIAVNRESVNISEHQQKFPGDRAYSPGGPSLKICIEFGKIHLASINTRNLGTQALFIGSAVNYASRLCLAGVGNRCLIGPVAASRAEFSSFTFRSPRHVAGKHGEAELVYYELSLAEHWREGGPRQPPE